jgi:heptosyltransferase-2
MKIAVFFPNWIGDAVMATPAVRALRERFAAAHLIGIMKPYVAGVIEGLPWLDSVIFLDSGGRWSSRWPAVAARLRREGIDLAVLFPNSFRSALVARLGGCWRRVGYARYCRGFLLTERLEPVRDARGRLLPSPVIDAYNRLAQALGCQNPGYRMELATTECDEKAADRVWRQTRLESRPEVICLNPGAAFGSAKHWPVESFAGLAQRLVDQRGSGVLVLCGPAESDMARQIVRLAGRPGVHSLADSHLSLGLTKACIRRSDLLITTDSGPRHFAAAFGRPVLTLFGPTHIAWTETYYAKAIHQQKPVPCGPCQLRVCPLDHRCMKELSVAEVFESATQLLVRFPPVPARRTA